MENNEEKVVEQPSLEDLRRQKEELERAKLQAEIEALNKEAEERKRKEQEAKEQEEVKQYTYGKPIEVVDTSVRRSDIDLIEEKFKKMDYAIANFEAGHPDRKPFGLTDSYNGQNLLDGYYRYTKGEKVADIFKNILE